MYTNEDWGSENKSPFYPTGFLTTNDVVITPPYYINAVTNSGIQSISGFMFVTLGDHIVLKNDDYSKFNATTKNKNLF
jgi:hypothetical protein